MHYIYIVLMRCKDIYLLTHLATTASSFTAALATNPAARPSKPVLRNSICIVIYKHNT